MVMVGAEWGWSVSDAPPRVRPRAALAWWTLCSAERGSADWGLIPLALGPAVPYGTWASSCVTGFPPPPSRSPSRRGALGYRVPGPSPKPPMGSSTGGRDRRFANLWVQPLRLMPLRRWRCAAGAAPQALGRSPWGAKAGDSPSATPLRSCPHCRYLPEGAPSAYASSFRLGPT